MRKRFVLPILSAVLALVGCALDDTTGDNATTASPKDSTSSSNSGNTSSSGNQNNGGSGSTSSSGTWDTTYSAQVVKSSSDVIILRSPTLDIYHWCSSRYDDLGNETTILDADTGHIGDDTLTYLATGSTLLIAGDTSKLPNGRYIRWSKYARVGTGTGIAGTWNEVGDTVIPLAGLSASDPDFLKKRARIDSANALRVTTRESSQVEFSASTVVIRRNFGDWALQELAEWLSYEAAYYSKVTAKRIDAKTLTFTGTDGVVVTKLHLDRSRTQYSSSDPTKYPTYVDYENPSSVAQCPENRWFYSFLSNYSSSSNGIGARQAVPVAAKPSRKLWR